MSIPPGRRMRERFLFDERFLEEVRVDLVLLFDLVLFFPLEEVFVVLFLGDFLVCAIIFLWQIQESLHISNVRPVWICLN
jgi:hypothetical protein